MHDFLPQPYCSKVPGIYAIVNRNNQKIYIGSAAKLNTRWNGHRYDLFRGRHNRYLLRAFRKDPSAFYLEVVEEMPGSSKSARLDREQFWMDFYQSCVPAKGYNLCPKAASCEGVKHGPEFGAAVSARAKGKKWSEETKAHYRKVRTWPTGWHWSEKSKKIASDAHKGQKWTDSQRDKFKRWHVDNPFHCKKPVVQISKNGGAVRRFGSVTEAEAHFGKRSNITAVCKGKRPFCFGFKWEYTDK